MLKDITQGDKTAVPLNDLKRHLFHKRCDRMRKIVREGVVFVGYGVPLDNTSHDCLFCSWHMPFDLSWDIISDINSYTECGRRTWRFLNPVILATVWVGVMQPRSMASWFHAISVSRGAVDRATWCFHCWSIFQEWRFSRYNTTFISQTL
jgi:hypothetical protein